jgi:hypothetical protein
MLPFFASTFEPSGAVMKSSAGRTARPPGMSAGGVPTLARRKGKCSK